MKSIIFGTLYLISFFCAFGDVRAADLGVQPLYFEFEKRGASKEKFEVTISAYNPTKVRFSVFKATQDITGKLNFIEAAEQDVVELKENSLTFLREGTKTIEGIIKYPKRVNKTIVYALMVEEDKGDASTGIGIMVRYAVVLKINTSNKRVFEKGKISKIGIKKIKKHLILEGLFENTTIKDYRIDSIAYIKDEAGRTVERLRLRSGSSWQKRVDESIVFPNSRIRIFGPLRKVTDPGKYQVLLVNRINGKRQVVGRKSIVVTDKDIESEEAKVIKRGVQINPSPIEIKISKGKTARYRIEIINSEDKDVNLDLPNIKLTDGKEYSFIPNRIRIGKGKKKFALLKIKNNHDKVWQPKELLFKINKEGEGEVEISIPIKILY